MEKQGHNNIYGLPAFLDHFIIKDENLAKKKCKEVVDNKFDYKAEEKMLKELIQSKYKWERCGGPLTKKVLDLQPSKKEHIEHLEKRFDMEWVRPPKVFYNFREAHSPFVDEAAKKPLSDMEPPL